MITTIQKICKKEQQQQQHHHQKKKKKNQQQQQKFEPFTVKERKVVTKF